MTERLSEFRPRTNHVVFIVEYRAWCSGCGWEYGGSPMTSVEEAADAHVYHLGGRIRPGWGVNKTVERARVVASSGDASGTLGPQLKRRDRPGASTPTAGGLCTPQSDITGRRVVQP